MKRPLGFLVTNLMMAAALVAPSGATPAAPRVETQAYEFGSQVGASVLGPIVAEAMFEGGPHRFAHFEIEDSSGQPVLAEIVQADRVDTFCGATAEPIPITPDFDITVDLFAGRCVDGTPSIVTTGTITATFFPGNPWAGDRRDLDRPYSIAAPGPYFGVDPPVPGNLIVANVKMPVGPQRFVSLDLEDASGSAVAAVLTQGGAEIARFCSGTSKPVRIRPWFAVEVFLHVGTCEDGTTSSPTSGVIKAVFSKSR